MFKNLINLFKFIIFNFLKTFLFAVFWRKVFLFLFKIKKMEVNDLSSQANLEKKQAYVQEISEKIKNANAGVIISYKGINSKDVTQMRKELREAEVDYFVIKNTMLKLASEQAGFDFSNELVGTTAVALCKDEPIAASKILTNYANKLEKTTEFKIKTGFLNKEIISVEKIKEIGSLPSRDQLLSQILNIMLSPITGLAVCINAIAEKNDETSPTE